MYSRGVIVSNIAFSTSKGALVGCPRGGVSRRCVIPRNARVVNRGTFCFGCSLQGLILPLSLSEVRSGTFRGDSLCSVA